MVETKTCTQCLIKKPITEFYFATKTRLMAICKMCCKLNHAEYTKKNKEKIQQRTARYREINRERLNQKSRERYDQNREKEQQRKKVYYQQNKEKYKITGKLYRINNPEKIRLRHQRYVQYSKDAFNQRETPEYKICPKCKQNKPSDQFCISKINKSKLSTYCKQCQKDYSDNTKYKVIEYYSNKTLKCSICGYDNLKCLTIDHINGKGTKHRKSLFHKGGGWFYRWLINNNFPDGYQVLCMNCQSIKIIINNECNKLENPSIKTYKARLKKEQIRIDVLKFYSNNTLTCKNCGFDDIRALELDHINGDGKQHRQEIGNSWRGSGFYQYLKNRNYPNDKYPLQILCANCNRLKVHENNEWVK